MLPSLPLFLLLLLSFVLSRVFPFFLLPEYLQRKPPKELFSFELPSCANPDVIRTIMNCDVYNGLEGWAVSEVTVAVTCSPYKEDDKRYYAETVSIEPLRTEQIVIRLGILLPSDTRMKLARGRFGPLEHHWGWQIVEAKGHPIR